MNLQNNQRFQPHPGSVRRSGRLGWWMVVLLGLPLAGLIIWGLAFPGSLSRLIGPYLSPEVLKVDGLILRVDGQDKLIPPEGRLRVHPQATVAVARLLTNRWRNYDLRLYSPDFDLALANNPHQPVTLAQVMGLTAFDQDQEISILVKADSQTVAAFTLLAGFSALDWAAKGEAAAVEEQRINYYLKALERQPDLLSVRRKLAETLAAQNRLEEVAGLWEEAFILDPNPQYLERSLDAYREAGQLAGQEKTLKRLIELAEAENRPRTDHLRALAGLYMRQAKWPEAEEIYEKLLARAENGDKRALLMELADLYRQGGQTEKERQTWRRLLAEAGPGQKPSILSEIIRLSESLKDETGLREAWRELAEALPDGPQKAAAYKKQGFLEVQAGGFTEARRAYQTALDLDPEDPNVYLNLARIDLVLGLKASRRENLEKLIRLQPENYDYLSELIDAYQSEGLRESAISALRDFLARQPGQQPARLRLVALLEEQGDQAALLAEYEILLENAPEDKVALYNLGVLSHNAGRLDLAAQAFEKAVALEPSDLEARSYLLVIYQTEKKDDLMAAQARAIYEMQPERTDARDLALNYWREAKKWPELAQLAEKWLKTAPEDPVLWRALSQAKLEQGDKLKAAEHLRSAAELTPEQVEPWLWAGSAFEEAGQPEEAQKAYQKALNVAPQNAKASEALLRLNQRRLRGGP